ncbi:hypothetical protein [Microbacterium atlanticum]|uniref:hypothetical protein n=1 Tax=Microbacterium atlanticum TaxID=2782168 RepID=UPI0018895645|nr:hypothetical protein [Microbacterium atlanticum]
MGSNPTVTAIKTPGQARLIQLTGTNWEQNGNSRRDIIAAAFPVDRGFVDY